MKQPLVRFAKLIIYLSFAVPWVVVPSSFIFPFIVPKILILRSLVTLGVAAYILLLIINWEEYRPRRTLITVALTAFIGSFVLSTIFGVDPYHSFWDNHERMLGLFTILHYFGYYLICTAVFRGWSEWKWALRLFMLAGSVVMVIGLLQVGNPQLLLNQGSERVASTLGNPIYVGGYGLFLFFVALLLFLKEKLAVWRYLDVLVGIMALAGLYYSGTRGSMIGLVVGVGVVLCGYVLLLKERPSARSALGIGLAGGALLLGFLVVNRHSPWMEKIPTLSRLFNISFQSSTGQTRLIAWRIAVKAWRQLPVAGWGPNNFFYAFNQYYNPHSLVFGYGETWFDNAHNILVNTLTVQGVVGVVTYLAIFILGLWALWRGAAWRDQNRALVVVGSGFLLAHLAQNITVFENPTSYLYFMFWLAFLNQMRQGERVAPAPAPGKLPGLAPLAALPLQAPDRPLGVGVALGAGVAALAIIFIFNIQPARANQKTLLALAGLSRDPAVGIPAMRQALAFRSPHIDDIRSDLARSIIELLSRSYQALGAELSREMIDLVYPELQKNIALHPVDIRNYLAAAQLAQIAAIVTNNPQYFIEAERHLAAGLQYSPRRQQIVYALSGIKAQLGKTSEAVALLEGSIADEPLAAESYWRLAFIYHFLGQTESARATIIRAKERGIIFTDQGAQVEALVMAGAATGTKQ